MHHCEGEREQKEETVLRLLDEETTMEENGNHIKSQAAYKRMGLKSFFKIWDLPRNMECLAFM